MKALIIGCNGLLGQNLMRTLPAGGSWKIAGIGLRPEPVPETSLSGYRSLDVTKRPELESAIAHFSPDLILNAAAMTNVDLCEREKSACSLVNRDAVGWMADTGIPLVHISTDYVFDGEAGPYSESDATRPLSHYGVTKLESEALALSGSSRSLVLRTMTLWGKGHGDKTSFVDFVKNSLATGKTIRIVTDQFGNPTLAEDLATAVWKLVLAGKAGIYHAAGSEWNSRFQWAEAIAAHYQLDAGLIQPCLTADLKQAARRPLKSGLKIDKLVRDTGFRPRNVAEQLARVDELAQTA